MKSGDGGGGGGGRAVYIIFNHREEFDPCIRQVAFHNLRTTLSTEINMSAFGNKRERERQMEKYNYNYNSPYTLHRSSTQHNNPMYMDVAESVPGVRHRTPPPSLIPPSKPLLLPL